ncbi:hypothetical protein [Aestuariibacter salexigens]|uniref:hypothetical protein n=1 Tax=Aestuariibacter salexigens TaxID=226010 RepID=UPI0003FB4701|nr:hypothetical protein [Aestuariibacter salexigens]
MTSQDGREPTTLATHGKAIHALALYAHIIDWQDKKQKEKTLDVINRLKTEQAPLLETEVVWLEQALEHLIDMARDLTSMSTQSFGLGLLENIQAIRELINDLRKR